jgi:hypothetical protein
MSLVSHSFGAAVQTFVWAQAVASMVCSGLPPGRWLACQQWHDPGQHRLWLPEMRAASVIVHRKDDVSAVGEDVGAAALVVLQTDSVMADEHRRPRTLIVGTRQVSDHRQAVNVVDSLPRNDHGRNAIEFIRGHTEVSP